MHQCPGHNADCNIRIIASIILNDLFMIVVWIIVVDKNYYLFNEVEQSINMVRIKLGFLNLGKNNIPVVICTSVCISFY